MKVVILAGGKGTRISETKNSIPKPLVKIGSKPIIHHIMHIFAKQGFNDFIVAGGYKYAMSGENMCFAHCPKYSFQYKPFLSGWMSNFNGLSTFGFDSEINFDKDSNPFMGSTFDSTGIYRFINIWEVFLNDDNYSIKNMHQYIKYLQSNFLDKLDKKAHNIFNSQNIIGRDNKIGNYIGFIIKDTQLCKNITESILKENIIVDNRQDILRIGFGIYHTEQDINRLVKVLSEI